MTGTSDARDAHRVERSDQDTPHFYNDIEIGFCIIKVAFDAHNRRADYRFVEVNAAFEK